MKELITKIMNNFGRFKKSRIAKISNRQIAWRYWVQADHHHYPSPHHDHHFVAFFFSNQLGFRDFEMGCNLFY